MSSKRCQSDAEISEVERVEEVKEVKKAKRTGDAVFELGGKKKVTVQEFKGMQLVNIREFYIDKATGEEKV